MNAIIFAAGLGTRLKPLTDTMPKALVPVNGRPLLDHVLQKLLKAGATEIVINVHHFAEQIKAFVKDYPVSSQASSQLSRERSCLPPSEGATLSSFLFPLSSPNSPLRGAGGVILRISDETNQLLETGGGLKKALPLFTSEEPVLIHNVDILSNVNLADFYQKAQENDVTLLVSQRKTTRYLLFNDDMRLVGWTNIQTGEVRSPYKNLDPQQCRRYAFSGIHCVKPSIKSLMADWPDRFAIMDFYLKVCADINICGYVKEDLRLLDVGKLDSLSEAETFFTKKRIAIFASGSGTNAEAIARYFQDSDEAEVALLVSNKENAPVHQRMKQLHIPTYTFAKEEWKDGSQVLALMQQERIDLIVLAGFLAFIPTPLLKAFPNRIINIHPSLLPKYGGKGMWGMNVHRAVIEAGEKESGITIHYVTEEVDGGEIIFQATCQVTPTDTPETLANRIHQLEHRHFPQVIQHLLQ